jgi:drug/metabolite transporter (DMT)-like permease
VLESIVVDAPSLGPAFGMVAALSSALAWTLVALITRDLASEFPTLSINILRSGVAGVFLVPLALVAGDPRGLWQVSAGAWVYIVLSVLTALGVGDTAFFESTKLLGMSRALIISTAAYPLLAGALALWWFGERITPMVALGSLITLGGLVLIVSERSSAVTEVPVEARRRGLGLAFVTAFAWAVAAAVMKPALAEVDPFTIQAVRLPLSTVVLWATPWARGTVRTAWARRHAVGGRVLALGALTSVSAVGYLAGLKYAGVTLGTVLSSVSPLFALPIGYFVFAERLSWRATAGAGLSIAGIAVLSL